MAFVFALAKGGEGQAYGRCIVSKFPKDKKVKSTGLSEIHQPVVGEADFREADPRALEQLFVPMVEQRPTADLIVNARNARTHNDRQVDQLSASVLKFGWIIPIVVNDKGVVLAGHGRLRAAQRLGLKEVPIIVVKHLTEELQRAFMLADNRLAELAGWDEELLRIELQELSSSDRFRVRGDGLRHGRPRPPGGAEAHQDGQAGGGAGAGTRPSRGQRSRRPMEAREASSVVRQRVGADFLPEAYGR